LEAGRRVLYFDHRRYQVERLPIRMPAYRPAPWFGIVSLFGIMITMFFVEGLQYTVPSFLPFLAVMLVVYARTRPRQERGT
jgi:L-asparagine transporter-like permease